KNGSPDSGEPSTVTGANGSYTIPNLAPGSYTVREVVPSGYLRTGPTNSDNYVVTVNSNSDTGGNDFYNFHSDCEPGAVTGIYFVINGTKTVTDLRGNVNQGDVVTAYFTVNPGYSDTLSLVSYTAPDAYFDANHAGQQQVFDSKSASFGPGSYSL